MRALTWFLIAAAGAVVSRANAEDADCPAPTARERRVTRDRKLNEWKRDRRKEAAGRGERISHSTLAVTDDGWAIIQEKSRIPAGCRVTYFRLIVPTSACENDSMSEEELHVGCCTPGGCSAGPESWAYAFVDAVTLGQPEAVRRFMQESTALTITDAEGAIRTYRRTDGAARFREMMKGLPHWAASDTVMCQEPKRASGTFETHCAVGSGGEYYRFSLISSGDDLTDDKMVWLVINVQLDSH